MTRPTVSVIMPTYNGAALLGETLASLQAQTFGDFELILVDDCSTDDTVAIARSFSDPRFRVIEAPVNRRVVLTRNAAFALAQGRYIAALDHDDLCHPDRFARQVAYLDTHPDIVLAGTAANVLYEGTVLTSQLSALSTPPLIEWLMRIENPLVWSSVMFRAEAARRLEPFQRPEMVYAEDYDLYHRISAFGGIARLDDELLTYRRHGNGASQVQSAAMRSRAADVLAGVYAPLFGDSAAEIAALVTRHVMAHQPVRDRATFARLGETLVTLQDDFLRRRKPDAESRHLIRWETARRWARIGRAGLRAGGLSLSDAATVRPDHLGLGYAGIGELVLSRLIGTVRATRRRQKKRDVEQVQDPL